jgi:hypothetical protein
MFEIKDTLILSEKKGESNSTVLNYVFFFLKKKSRIDDVRVLY